MDTEKIPDSDAALSDTNDKLEGQSHSEKLRKRKEIGGPKGPEPTRYGDWEKKGRCIDF